MGAMFLRLENGDTGIFLFSPENPRVPGIRQTENFADSLRCKIPTLSSTGEFGERKSLSGVGLHLGAFTTSLKMEKTDVYY